jgi:hypothetical protein
MNFGPVLDWGRANFIIIVAFLLPPSGLLLAIARRVDGDRYEAFRTAVAALLGVVAWTLVLTM